MTAANQTPQPAAYEIFAVSIGEDSAQERLYREVSAQNADIRAWQEIHSKLSGWGVVTPPLYKDQLARFSEKSGVIEENIAAYVAMEGYGYTLKASFDPAQKGAWDKAKELLENERFLMGDERKVSDEEVEAYLGDLERKLRLQRARIQQYVDNAARIDGRAVTLADLRKVLRDDLERLGECYLEVLRDENGRPARLAYAPSIGIYKLPLDPRPVQVFSLERITPTHVRRVLEWRHFRVYVQVDAHGGRRCYFKQYGDPRIVSRYTGRIYETIEDLAKAETRGKLDGIGAYLASELIERTCLRDPLSPYGRTRYLPHAPNVSGVRSADEVNESYFDNKGVPPMAVLVDGGELTNASVARLEEQFKTTKGKAAFHKVMILAAKASESAAPGHQVGAPPKINLKSLWNEQLKDALFIEYTERSEKRISANYRTPPLLRGRADDYTRATAREALMAFEQLVAQGERLVLDGMLNETLWELDVTLWMYHAKGPDLVDLEAISKLFESGVKGGGLLPNDQRRILSKHLRDDELTPIEERWAKYPLELSKNGQVPLATAEEDASGEIEQNGPIQPQQGAPNPPPNPTPSQDPPSLQSPENGAPNDAEGEA